MQGEPGRPVPEGGRTRRLSRRSFLAAGVLGATAGTLSACGSGSPAGKGSNHARARVLQGPPGPGPVAGGNYGGSITVGWLDAANSYDSAVGWNDQAWGAISCLLNTPPYMFAEEFGDLQPALASALPQVSADGLHYRIPLRTDARFSNGEPVTAADYVYAWTRVLDPKVASWASNYLYPIAGAADVVNGKTSRLAGVRAVGDSTLEVTLSEPTFAFLNYLAEPFMAPVPVGALAKSGASWGTQPVSTGPFVVSSYSSSDQKSTFSRNPHYAWKGLPYLDGVTFTWGLNENLALLQLQQGEIDVVGDGIGSSVMPQVETESALRRLVRVYPQNATDWIDLNVKVPQLADPRVRQALNWATDREALAEITHGVFTASGYPLPNNLLEFTHRTSPFGHDPDRARSLLRQAGVSRLQFGLLTDGEDPWQDVLQLLQQQWASLGIDLQVKTVGESAWGTETSTVPLRIDSFQDDYFMDQPSALDLIIPNFTTKGSYNTTGYSNATLDQLVKMAQAQHSLRASNRYVEKIEKVLVSDPPAVFLFNATFPCGRNPKLRNFQYQSYFGPRYERMWL